MRHVVIRSEWHRPCNLQKRITYNDIPGSNMWHTGLAHPLRTNKSTSSTSKSTTVESRTQTTHTEDHWVHPFKLDILFHKFYFHVWSVLYLNLEKNIKRKLKFIKIITRERDKRRYINILRTEIKKLLKNSKPENKMIKYSCLVNLNIKNDSYCSTLRYVWILKKKIQ